MPPKQQQEPGRCLDEQERRFVLWALGSLKLSLDDEGAGQYRFTVPEDERADFADAAMLRFSFTANGTVRDRGQVPATAENENAAHERVCHDGTLTPESKLWSWLLKQMRGREQVWHALPESQPQRIHEISARLFSAYHVAGGNMHLGGCTLEERPVLRLSYWSAGSGEFASGTLSHCYVTPQGERLPQEQVAALSLDRLVPHTAPPRVNDTQLSHWKQAAETICRGDAERDDDLVAVTLIWCKHAEGKVTIEIGQARSEVPFSAWAKALVGGQTAPPAFRCSRTGLSSYRVAASDDGLITVEEAIATCDSSGKRVLEGELETCSATGKRVCRELLAECPVTRERLLETAFALCTMCQQKVHPRALRDQRCEACRNLRAVSKDDPRMARILGEHPKLDQWGRWRMSETARVYVVTAAALLRRLLLIINKETLELIRIAEGTRFSRRWVEAPPADQVDYD